MSKRSMAMALLALAGVVGATEAQAATTCGTTVTFSPGTQTINYDPFGTTDQTVALSVSITVPNNVNSVRLITTDSQSGSPTKVGTSGPQYQLLLNGTNIAPPWHKCVEPADHPRDQHSRRRRQLDLHAAPDFGHPC